MMSIENKNETFKKTLIIFWTLWWLIALWTDIVGTLAHLGILHSTWAPDSNYPFLVESLKMYQPPFWLSPLLYACILFWSALSAFIFCWASFSLFQERKVWFARAQVAFIITIIYWLAFFLADQLVMKFDLEQNHMVQGGFELLCFLALYLLPDKSEYAG